MQENQKSKKSENSLSLKSTPKVSVIIATYNRANYIHEAMDSVLEQSYSDWEIIIVDDASEDNTGEIVRKYREKDPRIFYYKNQKNLGIARTRNKGMELARGEYIAPLDSDDIWLDKNKLQKQVEFLDINQDYALLGGGIMHIDAKSQPVKKVLFPIYNSVIRNIILQFNPFAQSTLLFRKKIAIDCGGYSTDYKVCDDYELWLRIGTKYKFTNIPQILAGYRIHGGNITHTKRLTTAREILEIVRKYSKHYNRAYLGIIKAYMRILLSYIKT